MDIKKLLEKEVDIKFREFSSSLIPNVDNVLGIRTPVLRRLSKEIYKNNDYYELLKTQKFEYLEEYMLKGMVIGLLKEPIENILAQVSNFIPVIDNWAVCDSFCCSLKITNKYLGTVWNFLQPYFYSKKEYEVRFAYVMLLNYYLCDDYIDKVFTLIDKFKDAGYYSRMAVAWLISICYIKYPNKTDNYLYKSKLDDWTFNKSIQKICESMKIDKTVKNKIKRLKR